MQISLDTLIRHMAANGLLLRAAHMVIGANMSDSAYVLTQSDVDAIATQIDAWHAAAPRLLTPDADDTVLCELVGVTPTQEERGDRFMAECRALHEAGDDLKALAKIAGLYTPAAWID